MSFLIFSIFFYGFSRSITSSLFLRAHILDDLGALDYVYTTKDNLDENVIVTFEQIPEPSLVLGNGFIVIVLLKVKRKNNLVR